MIVSSSSLGRVFLCLVSIAVKISPHFKSNLPYYFCVSPDNIQDGKKKYWSFEKCARIPDNSTKKHVLQQKSRHDYFVFFLCSWPGHIQTYKLSWWWQTRIEFNTKTRERQKRSAPVPSLLNKSICCTQTTNALTTLATDTVSASFQIYLLRPWLFV